MRRPRAAILTIIMVALTVLAPQPAQAQTAPIGTATPTGPGGTAAPPVPGGVTAPGTVPGQQPGVPAQVGPAQTGPGGQTGPCQIAPVFAPFRDLVGRERVGECTAAVIRSDLGDLAQATTRGTLGLRAADYVLSFSDGQTTWLYGPRGLETRPSATRLPWESADPRAGQPTDPTLAGPARPATPSPPAVPLVDQPMKAEGSDSATSSPFDLAGGEYTVSWEARLPNGRSSCYVGSRLRRIEDTGPGGLIFHTTLNTSNDRSVGGESRLFAVPPGRYMVEVTTTGCGWRLEINPRR